MIQNLRPYSLRSVHKTMRENTTAPLPLPNEHPLLPQGPQSGSRQIMTLPYRHPRSKGYNEGHLSFFWESRNLHSGDCHPGAEAPIHGSLPLWFGENLGGFLWWVYLPVRGADHATEPEQEPNRPWIKTLIRAGGDLGTSITSTKCSTSPVTSRTLSPCRNPSPNPLLLIPSRQHAHY
jgi:hypothetical protein